MDRDSRQSSSEAARPRFSDELERWVQGDAPKSIGSLEDLFAERSFAVAMILLLVVSATPIPTGGITLAFQVMATIVAAQMVLGRTTLWIPVRWRKRELGATSTRKAIPFLVRRVRWFEAHSRPRWSGLFQHRTFIKFIGVVLMAFAIPAALAPPFSGLEILPALGGIIVALSILLEDALVLVIGMIIGTGGVLLFVSVTAALWRAVTNLF